MVDLPQELADLIIDELQDDRLALCACSLVSHSFYHPSRKYIFRKISLGPNSVDAFNKIIGSSPDIPFLVHELSIQRGTRIHKDWAVYSEVLPGIISRCANLRRLHLSKIVWRKAPVRFPTLRSAVENANLTFLDLKSCRFASYDDAARFFARFPRLKRLSVSGNLAEDDSLGCFSLSAPTTRIALDELDVGLMESISVMGFLAMSGCVFELGRLRVLQWDSCDDSDMFGIRVILRDAVDTLEHVSVGRCCCDQPGEPIDIRTLKVSDNLIFKLLRRGPTSVDQRLPEYTYRLPSTGSDLPDRDQLGMRALHSIVPGAVDRA
ncbi:uncharacterized protein EV420DRAFT_519448 [Desarmillaria tabescens]|uniref:F-box domain-containing protein n=1 Tax=Armillaria tabescens TaxID=1929756 RepID=A0AA39KA53_ARMTA|nr:uncharacterized protein EV420DRAFT_519448 [Desarmillaria tabescens]KAK0457315.1 hypothetical protein EV420DRAFT_519448 [Desarmillaria tabescens]